MSIKQQLLDECLRLIQKRIQAFKNEVELIKESLESNDQQGDDDDDSGRGKLLNDLETNMKHLSDANKSLEQLKLINPRIQSSSIVLGSIVETNSMNFFIAVSLGKIIIDTSDYFAISLASPIGQLLQQKTTGGKFEFNGHRYEILNIL